MGQVHYRELEQIQNVHDHIHNCQVPRYSRAGPPDGSSAPRHRLTRTRSV